MRAMANRPRTHTRPGARPRTGWKTWSGARHGLMRERERIGTWVGIMCGSITWRVAWVGGRRSRRRERGPGKTGDVDVPIESRLIQIQGDG
jgi:hypothetical protein